MKRAVLLFAALLALLLMGHMARAQTFASFSFSDANQRTILFNGNAFGGVMDVRFNYVDSGFGVPAIGFGTVNAELTLNGTLSGTASQAGVLSFQPVGTMDFSIIGTDPSVLGKNLLSGSTSGPEQFLTVTGSTAGLLGPTANNGATIDYTSDYLVLSGRRAYSLSLTDLFDTPITITNGVFDLFNAGSVAGDFDATVGVQGVPEVPEAGTTALAGSFALVAFGMFRASRKRRMA